MPDSTADRVLAVIAKTQHIAPEKVTPESTFADLGIDSLDGLTIVFALEEEFGIEIPDDQAKTYTAISEVITGIDLLLAAKAASA
jgi:acyl carrier protein